MQVHLPIRHHLQFSRTKLSYSSQTGILTASLLASSYPGVKAQQAKCHIIGRIT